MKVYGRGNANSGVTHYRIFEGGIDVRFSSGVTYHFTNESCGEIAVNEMRRLARSGKGLSGYIGRATPAHRSKSR